MKARSLARQLALMALYQAETGHPLPDTMDASLIRNWSLEAIRVMAELAQDEIETTGHRVNSLLETLFQTELNHPDNRTADFNAPLLPVPLPTTQTLREQLETLLEGLEKLQDAYILSEMSLLAQREDVDNYIVMLLRLVNRHQPDIDATIERHSRDWRLDRMQKMDKALLRLGVAEVVYNESVDVPAIIEEILTLANRFTTEEARKFIHGVLGAVASEQEAAALQG